MSLKHKLLALEECSEALSETALNLLGPLLLSIIEVVGVLLIIKLISLL
jgi:hypothetical protein